MFFHLLSLNQLETDAVCGAENKQQQKNTQSATPLPQCFSRGKVEGRTRRRDCKTWQTLLSLSLSLTHTHTHTHTDARRHTGFTHTHTGFTHRLHTHTWALHTHTHVNAHGLRARTHTHTHTAASQVTRTHARTHTHPPGGTRGKAPAYQCKRQQMQVRSLGRKIPWRRAWQPTLEFLAGESHGQRSLVGYSPWGHKESDTTEVT